jgi:sarcosine oxidase subunit delta
MRIPCPFCGDRDAQEFVYRGDAAPVRPTPVQPTPVQPTPVQPTDEAEVYGYVYLRENPAGVLREHWYHAQGCRQWLVVTRDTRTHEIFAAELAKDAAR